MQLTEENIFEVMNLLEEKDNFMKMGEIPNEVCKYRNWKSKIKDEFLEDRVITDLELFHASPVKFEDKDDCRNKVDYYELLNNLNLQIKLMINLAIRYLRDENKNISLQAVKDFIRETEEGHCGFENTTSYIDEWSEDEWTKFCSFTGVLSLCKSDNNERMWRDYAKEYTGACYVFNFESLKNDFDYRRDEYAYYNVIYEQEIKKISVLSSDDKKIFTRSAIKNKDKYSHEDEFRVCLKRKNLTTDLRKRYFSINTLTRVILGHEMSKNNFLEFVEVLKSKDSQSNVKLFRTSLDSDEHIQIENYTYWK
jgi:hypothetical protein